MQELNVAELSHIAGGLIHISGETEYSYARDLKPEN